MEICEFYLQITILLEVEPRGIEPLTSAVQGRNNTFPKVSEICKLPANRGIPPSLFFCTFHVIRPGCCTVTVQAQAEPSRLARSGSLPAETGSSSRTRSCARRVKHGQVSSASGGSSPHGSWPCSSSSCSERATRWFAPLPSASVAERGTSSVRVELEPTRTKRLRGRRDRRAVAILLAPSVDA